MLAFAVLMQLAVLGITPWTEVRASSSLGSHVEKPGELHQIHDENRCASCVMRHLVGDARRVPVATPAGSVTAEAPIRAVVAWSPSARVSPDAPRAPPRAG